MAQLLLDWETAIRMSNEPTIRVRLKSLVGEFLSRTIVRQGLAWDIYVRRSRRKQKLSVFTIGIVLWLCSSRA